VLLVDRINRWKLADDLTVYQIALLLAGYDPSEFEAARYGDWEKEVVIDTAPYVHAIKSAALSERFTFRKFMTYYGEDIDWDSSLVDLVSFREWLRSRNFNSDFFLGNSDSSDGISNPLGQFYAPKLAAAVRAWNEVTSDPAALNGKSPKKALEIWLRKHANEYGLTNKDGNPNELGIEEVCKVANWKPAGGATPTPALSAKPSQSDIVPDRKVRPKPPNARIADMIDDDIPF
jgi:hypothetical protein